MTAIDQGDVESSASTVESETDGVSRQSKRTYNRAQYPRVPLASAIDLAQAILKRGQGEDAKRTSAFQELGKKAEANQRQLIAAANTGYGLITGNVNAEFLGLQERGRRIVKATSIDERYQAAWEALKANKIFTTFVQRWHGNPLPNEEAASIHLRRTLALPETEAKQAYPVIVQNLSDFGFIEMRGERPYVRETPEATEDGPPSSEDEAATDVASTAFGQTGAEGGGTGTLPAIAAQTTQTFNPSVADPIQPLAASLPRTAVPEFHFNIQIHLPSDATPEAYDSIFRSIATHLLGRGE